MPPSPALARLDEIRSRLASQRLALFCDYDGTLTPIVSHPADATLSADMRRLLHDLADRCTVAIISGRDRADVEQMVQLDNLIFAGSHGFDIRGPQGLIMQHQQAEACLPDLDRAEQQLRERLAGIGGAWVERKRFALAVHYRQTADQDIPRVEGAVDQTRWQHPALRKMAGKRIFELQPDLPWNKGQAVLWLLKSLDLDRPALQAMYLGDDTTDEDAFAVLADRELGIGMLVGVPGESTRAQYFVSDTGEVQQFLGWLLKWQKGRP